MIAANKNKSHNIDKLFTYFSLKFKIILRKIRVLLCRHKIKDIWDFGEVAEGFGVYRATKCVKCDNLFSYKDFSPVQPYLNKKDKSDRGNKR